MYDERMTVVNPPGWMWEGEEFGGADGGAPAARPGSGFSRDESQASYVLGGTWVMKPW
jgi:hypothetical protein